MPRNLMWQTLRDGWVDRVDTSDNYMSFRWETIYKLLSFLLNFWYISFQHAFDWLNSYSLTFSFKSFYLFSKYSSTILASILYLLLDDNLVVHVTMKLYMTTEAPLWSQNRKSLKWLSSGYWVVVKWWLTSST